MGFGMTTGYLGEVALVGPPGTERMREPRSKSSFCAGFSSNLASKDKQRLLEPRQSDKEMPFDAQPGLVLEDPSVPYLQVPLASYADGSSVPAALNASQLLAQTPLPKGALQFSSLHIVAGASEDAHAQALALFESSKQLDTKASVYTWPSLSQDDVVGEYDAFFRIASEMILKGADRASLLVFVAAEGKEDTDLATAAILAMLPFRGVQAAFVTGEPVYRDPLSCLRTASGLFEYHAEQPERMGRRPLSAVFGPLPPCTFNKQLCTWQPIRPCEIWEAANGLEAASEQEKLIPFKIGGLDLPMLTFEGGYAAGIARLAELLLERYGCDNCFPVLAVGETVDALGYGWDIYNAMAAQSCQGHYFAHASGESFKRPDAFGKPELLAAIATAKKAGRRVVVIAVGGGVNGNAMGMIAAMTGSDFVEVPTTLMHFNDATTSAKKAFSLVVGGKILSKNILGTFYLPKLVFCISEVFLTLDPCSIHAAAGEASKTMSMLGKASSCQGRLDFHNILGAGEFASDFTKVAAAAVGFERLIVFLQNTSGLKSKAIATGRTLRSIRKTGVTDSAQEAALESQRHELLGRVRAEFNEGLPEEGHRQVVHFLMTINEEVIKAKAMFLAYSDPFEKYRALLFEYAHTLGHGVEAFANSLYRRAEALRLDYSEAFRLHGQCVGMAVLWAGEMSKELGYLDGDGYMAHQGLVCLFNRFAGFDFGPLRQLCEQLDVSRDEFCEGVLDVVRRDNKRGYCRCAPGSSVDQLVRERPGCLVRSDDPSAELRYLVEVSEDVQRQVLESAFEGQYDQFLVTSPTSSSGLALLHRSEMERKQ
ncbi:unnamed protein product [Polarella glacialis]|uniref:3-dehydroquinate synthase N-terminal domain-containing protein n=1 Tax=Polarella glacialis TaxID=89957 RepID=A0A813DDN3_POLGL|nr:unnamed protein product [Polarella glacialis]